MSILSRPSLLKIALSPKRSSSSLASTENELFNYTSGRWVYNEALRLKERRLVFDVDEFMQLTAKSVDRQLSDIIDFSKLSEGKFNRMFLITFKDSFQMVARVPYPMTVPKYYAVASEVVTMEYLRLSGLPIPEIYGYSPGEDNAAGIPYILMECIKGRSFKDSTVNDEGVADVIRQVTQLEGKMTALSFPAGGSLYFAKDLEKVGLQGQLDVDRGPYANVEHALVAGAHKELAYLKRFGRPLLPFRRELRPPYTFQPQQPSDHTQNLERYLSVTPTLIPKDHDLHRFSITHPYPSIGNLILDRDGQIVSIIDWQQTSVLPIFLLAQWQREYGEPNFKAMKPPSPRDTDQHYLQRLMQCHYVKNSERFNELHHRAFSDPFHALRLQLFKESCVPWKGDTLQLTGALFEAFALWDELTAVSACPTRHSQCPFEFNDEDAHQAGIIAENMVENVEGLKEYQDLAGGVADDGWVPVERYDNAKAVLEGAKRAAIKMGDDPEFGEESKQIVMAHWLFDDMDEEDYM
ncbi:kinase-like domain-containing protein [Coprinopsis sp. MPI-PUGE-AT-0042]|nr:kinase-like domain-containing protein [Coprinopsis sp. MPI-PUGE-AT-0042]